MKLLKSLALTMLLSTTLIYAAEELPKEEQTTRPTTIAKTGSQELQDLTAPTQDVKDLTDEIQLLGLNASKQLPSSVLIKDPTQTEEELLKTVSQVDPTTVSKEDEEAIDEQKAKEKVDTDSDDDELSKTQTSSKK